MRWLVLSIVVGAVAGCESCDFSFGLIPVTVAVTGTDEVAQVTVCAEEQPCVVVTTLPAFPTDTTTTPIYTADGRALGPGDAYADVHWQGYTTCRVPAMTITVEAPGCAPATLHTDEARPDDADTDHVIALDCG
jgi:hypothetical protein